MLEPKSCRHEEMKKQIFKLNLKTIKQSISGVKLPCSAFKPYITNSYLPNSNLSGTT